MDTALQNTTELRLFRSLADTFPGEPIIANLGVDSLSSWFIHRGCSVNIARKITAGAGRSDDALCHARAPPVRSLVHWDL